MKRRAFLGFLGGAAAAGPAAIKTAAEMTTADLNLGRMGLAAGSPVGPSSGMNAADNISWAKDSLKRLAGISKLEKDMRKKRYWSNELDPQIATLRSVSLTARIRMSKEAQFERSEEREKSYLEGVIAGLWS